MERTFAFEREPHLRELATRILRTGTSGGTPWAELEDTILYPEGGGQPSDTGRINGVRVTAAVREGGTVRHLLDSPLDPGPATVELDWDRRYDHMQQHTAQHLLTAVAQDRFGWPTTAFHLGPSVCDVELDVPSLAPGDLRTLEEAVATELRAARPVRARHADPGDLDALGVRTRGLPENHRGPVRLVEIEGVDLNTCGGTHVASTAEIECVALLGTQRMRGGTRVFFVAGGRVRTRMAEHEARNAGLREQLGAPDEELVEALRIKLDQLKEATRLARRLQEALAEERARRLAAAPESVVALHDPDGAPASLQALARRLLDLAPGKLSLLTAGGNREGHFLLAAGPECGRDLQEAGTAVAAILEGRGGGRPPFFQGRATRLDRVPEALEALRRG